MPVFASRSPRRDAARRASPLLAAFRFWAFPVAILCAWLAAGSFSVSALVAASAAWSARTPRAAFSEEILVRSPALPTRRISKVRAAGPAIPACPSAGFHRPGAVSYDPG